MSSLIEREYDIITPSEFCIEYLHPERLLIKFDSHVKAKPFDIGAWCYTKREAILPGWDTGKLIKPRRVYISSFVKHRREFILRYLDYLYASGNRHSSMWSNTKMLQKIFEWADANNHSDFLKSQDCIVKAYKAFTENLFHQILVLKTLNPESSSQQQRAFFLLLELLYPDDSDELKAKSPVIKATRAVGHSPSIKNVEEYLGSLVPFVRNLRNAIMYKDFPFTFECGSYDITIIPRNNNSVISPFTTACSNIYNIHENRLYSFDEYYGAQQQRNAKRNYCIAEYERDHSKLLSNLEEANSDRKHSYYRKVWAQKVIRGYASLIQVLTGVNPSDLVKFDHQNGIDISTSPMKKELVGVKFRASGKVVTYPIGGRLGLKLLKEYIEFRTWYLDGRTFKYLFFTDIGVKEVNEEIVLLRNDFQSRFFKQLKGRVFSPDSKNITPSKSRKFKSIIMRKMGVSIKDVAIALNHSEEVNNKHYSAPDIDDMKEELGLYWSSVRALVSSLALMKQQNNKELESTTVGHCDDLGNAVAAEIDIPIEPNCNNQYGCLYCKHYVCHADEEDIRKLFCLKYVLLAVRNNAAEIERSNKLFQDLCVRVEAIIERIESEYPEMRVMVSSIRKEVFELGLLTPFWESRYARYEKMGIII
jgi:hypothetical protein